MNNIDVSCAACFDGKVINGPIPKMPGGISNGFRIKRFAFATINSVEQNVAGLREHGGRITRGPFIFLTTFEIMAEAYAAACSHAHLGDFVLVIYHNLSDNKRLDHTTIKLKKCSIHTAVAIDGSKIKTLDFNYIARQLTEPNFSLPVYLKKNLFSMNYDIDKNLSIHSNEYMNQYMFISMTYVEITISTKFIDLNGDVKGTESVDYQEHRTK